VADTDGILGRVAALIASGHHHRQALPREPDPVLPNHRAAAGHRGDHGLGTSPTGADPEHAWAHGRTGRTRHRSDGRL